MGFISEGDCLTPELLEENPYQCSFCMSCMNMCIGKISQSNDRKTVEFVDCEDRLTELFANTDLDIKSCFLMTDDHVQVTYAVKDTCLAANRKAQMCVNTLVTAMSRIYLDKSLRLLQDNSCDLIYLDTDSIGKVTILIPPITSWVGQLKQGWTVVGRCF